MRCNVFGLKSHKVTIPKYMPLKSLLFTQDLREAVCVGRGELLSGGLCLHF